MEEAAKKFLELDTVNTLVELQQKIDKTCLPPNVLMSNNATELSFFVIRTNSEGVPQLAFHIKVFEDMTFDCWCNGIHVSPTRLSHLTKSKFVRASEVQNAVVFLNNMSETNLPAQDKIEFAISVLEDLLPDLESDAQGKLSFILEQLDLVLKSPKSRRYSPYLLAMAMMWHSTSPALYQQLRNEGILTMPSVRHLRRLSSALNIDGSLSTSTVNYLKMRTADLGPLERNVSIIIDEVYCEQRVEYVNGKLHGLTSDGVTKTLLCYMVRSVASNYRDMIAMEPITKINWEVIRQNFNAVCRAVTEIGLNVVCVSADGYSANRKFFEELCGGTIAHSIPHPVTPDERLFLIFDPVHIFKNFFSNFLNRAVLSGPTFEGKKIAATFKHISDLYVKEFGKPMKHAHKITQKVLTPRPIERSNVMLAERLFHESTIAALKHYSDENPEWENTAEFLDLIHTWWSIVNVRSTSVGFRKRDDNKKAITRSSESKLEFLTKFVLFMKEWRDTGSKSESLTRETLSCAIQTSSALSALAIYLLEQKDFKFVMLGKISSDAIEHRFGHYRQLGGANYYLSVRQFLEAEKAIRLKSLVKYSKLTMEEVTSNLKGNDNGEFAEPNDSSVLADTDLLMSFLEEESFEISFFDDEDASIIYFVAGYIARSLMKLRKTPKCCACAALFGDSEDMPPVLFSSDVDCEPDRRSEFLEKLNRGGLQKPSDLLYMFCLHANEIQRFLFSSPQAKAAFLSIKEPRRTFVAVVIQKLESNAKTAKLVNTTCTVGHSIKSFLEMAASAYCNCMMKNYVSEVNDQCHEARKRTARQDKSAAARKIAKLQSEK